MNQQVLLSLDRVITGLHTTTMPGQAADAS